MPVEKKVSARFILQGFIHHSASYKPPLSEALTAKPSPRVTLLNQSHTPSNFSKCSVE